MKIKLLMLITLVLLVPLISAADEKGAIELKSVAEVEIEVTNEKGEKEMKRVDASKAEVLPGDEVIFTTYYSHIGKEAAEDIVITNPVPEHMTYVAKSAEGEKSQIVFSIDGGKTYDFPSRLKVKEGPGRERPARVDEYTHIRWQFPQPLNPGDKGEVSFRAKVK